MDYDTLEEQYYILSQRNKNLEQHNNALESQVIELESQAVVDDSVIRTAQERVKNLSALLAAEVGNVVNLNAELSNLTIKITDLDIVLNDVKKKLTQSLEDIKSKKEDIEYLKSIELRSKGFGSKHDLQDFEYRASDLAVYWAKLAEQQEMTHFEACENLAFSIVNLLYKDHQIDYPEYSVVEKWYKS